MRSHLISVHKRASAHHAAMSGFFAGMAKCAGAMGKADGGEIPDHAKTIAQLGEFCEDLSDESEGMAAFHEGAADDLQKMEQAAQAELQKAHFPDGLEPMAARATIPVDNPMIKAVPRTGARALPVDDGADLPEAFRDLLKIE